MLHSIFLASGLVLAATEGIANHACDLKGFVDDQQKRTDVVQKKYSRVIGELKDVQEVRVRINDQLQKLYTMNSIKRGFKAQFDLNYDVEYLENQDRDLLKKQYSILQNVTLIKLEIQSLDIEKKAFEQNCGINFDAPNH